MPRLAGASSRCHKNSNTLQQQQQQLDMLVQFPRNYVAVVWTMVVVMVVVVVVVPLVHCSIRFGALFPLVREMQHSHVIPSKDRAALRSASS